MRSHPGDTSISPSPETWASVASPEVPPSEVATPNVSASNTPTSHLPPTDATARPCQLAGNRTQQDDDKTD